jgi:alkylhydroperoxidase family enzyme
MSETAGRKSAAELDPEIAGVLRRWREHTGELRERRSLYHSGTVLAVTGDGRAQFVLKEVVKGQPVARRLEQLAAEHRLLHYLRGSGVPVPNPLAAQLFFVQVFATRRNQEHLRRNLDALTWLHEHRDELERLLSGP